jgi:anti-sigma-K factor RskA
MSGQTEHTARSDDAAAYVLGALDEDEAAEFGAHARSCPICAAEVARFSSAVAVLPLGVRQLTAPTSLRRRVLKEAASDARGGRRTRMRGLRSWPRFAQAGLSGAVALAAGVVIGALLLAPGRGPTTLIRATVASAAAWHAAGQPVAELERYGDRGQLLVSRLPAAAAGKVYELWIERDGAAHATNVLFEPTSSGAADVDVPGDLNGASAVLVTAERLGGAKVPTMAPLIDAQLPS